MAAPLPPRQRLDARLWPASAWGFIVAVIDVACGAGSSTPFFFVPPQAPPKCDDVWKPSATCLATAASLSIAAFEPPGCAALRLVTGALAPLFRFFVSTPLSPCASRGDGGGGGGDSSAGCSSANTGISDSSHASRMRPSSMRKRSVRESRHNRRNRPYTARAASRPEDGSGARCRCASAPWFSYSCVIGSWGRSHLLVPKWSASRVRKYRSLSFLDDSIIAWFHAIRTAV
mmetsp:Transcript_4290/g.10498  ORF Transcript_4290/g.10498 Transcript_4290/m.10498 type:complete len:231 (-) Transcript_4290:1622-2314(-)